MWKERHESSGEGEGEVKVEERERRGRGRGEGEEKKGERNGLAWYSKIKLASKQAKKLSNK